MTNKFIAAWLAASLITVGMPTFATNQSDISVGAIREIHRNAGVHEEIMSPVDETVKVDVEEKVDTVVAIGVLDPKPEYPLTEEEIRLVALITASEASVECEEGIRLVIDTILNRIDSEHFPNTVNGVIYQKDQYKCVWNGQIHKWSATDKIIQLVKEELLDRTNSDVLFFRTKHYHKFGTPLMKVGNHYFSTW